MTRRLTLLTLSALLASTGAVLAQGDAEAGRTLAQRWCSSCHMIDAGQGAASATGVPTFAGIARMPSTTEMSLNAFLRTPHVRMPDLHLSNSEITDLSAYILGLKPR